MDERQEKFLTELLTTPSVSGFEAGIQKVVRKYLEESAEDIQGDSHGNLIAGINTEGKVRVMLAGHCDQIGLMVNYIDDKGFIRFKSVGGVDAAVVPGTRVLIHSSDGPVAGVIGHKPVHLSSQSERGKKVDLKDLWIDVGSTEDKKVTDEIAIGDPVTFQLQVESHGAHVLSAAGCDDRVGLFVVVEAFLLAAKTLAKGDSPVALFVASTVQEELGLRGARTAAYSINPDVGIAVDVTHASDNPGVDAKETGKVELGKGPTIARGANINQILERRLLEAAKRSELPVQRIAAPKATGTDANAMQVNMRGVATALIGIPNRYMHTPIEMVDKRDIDTAIKLIAETVCQIEEDASFIPV